MPVYVDQLLNHGGSATFKWKHSCHLLADTEEELHAFAKLIGMKREWFQKSRRGLPHYDLNASRRAVAVQRGAIEISSRETGERQRAYWKMVNEQEREELRVEVEGHELNCCCKNCIRFINLSRLLAPLNEEPSNVQNENHQESA